MKDELLPPQTDNLPSPPWFYFGDKVVPCIRQVSVENFSVTTLDQVASIAFDNLLEDIQGRDTPLSAITSLALELPAEILSKDSFIGYVSDLRGSCIKSLGARAILVAELGGTTFIQSFPYDEPHEDENWFGQVFSFERRPNNDSGLPIVPLPPFTINVTISVQRRTPEDFVQLTLDSIDLTADRG